MPQLPHLKAWRDSRVLTQRELGEASGVNWMTIHRLEHGQSAHPGTIRKLAAALGIAAPDLLKPPPA